jgi:hypothetical protein
VYVAAQLEKLRLKKEREKLVSIETKHRERIDSSSGLKSK